MRNRVNIRYCKKTSNARKIKFEFPVIFNFLLNVGKLKGNIVLNFKILDIKKKKRWASISNISGALY